MIQQNCNKVNSYNSALKPLPRLPNRSKWPYLWDILIYETSGPSRSTGKRQGSHLCLPKFEGNWREKSTRHPPQPPLHTTTPPRHPQTSPDIPISPLTYHKHCQMQPSTFTNIPDTQQTSSDTLISPKVLPDLPGQPKWLSDCLTIAWEYSRLFLGHYRTVTWQTFKVFCSLLKY